MFDFPGDINITFDQQIFPNNTWCYLIFWYHSHTFHGEIMLHKSSVPVKNRQPNAVFKKIFLFCRWICNSNAVSQSAILFCLHIHELLVSHTIISQMLWSHFSIKTLLGTTENVFIFRSFRFLSGISLCDLTLASIHLCKYVCVFLLCMCVSVSNMGRCGQKE